MLNAAATADHQAATPQLAARQSGVHVANCVSISDPGRRREVNEDAVLALSDVALYAVADGTRGKDAAPIVCQAMKRTRSRLRRSMDEVAHAPDDDKARLGVRTYFQQTCEMAGRAIRHAANGSSRPGLASTLAAVTIGRHTSLVAHVGNSRVYLFRDGTLCCLTSDHTVAMQQLRQGLIDADEWRVSTDQRKLTQALGVTRKPQVEMTEVVLLPGDVLLLCTDGLSNVVAEERVAGALATGDLRLAARELVRLAFKAGAPDNLSMVLLDIARAPEVPRECDVDRTWRRLRTCPGKGKVVMATRPQTTRRRREAMLSTVAAAAITG